MNVVEITRTPGYSGIAVMINNIVSNIASSDIRIDVISPINDYFLNKEKNNKCKYLNFIFYKLPKGKIIGSLGVYFQLRKLLRKNKYDIIHIHSDRDSFSLIAVLASRKLGAKIIFHAHNQSINHEMLNKITKKTISKYCDAMMSCSDFAAKAMIPGNEWQFVKNGIDYKTFMYSESVRKRIRKRINVSEEQILIGNVGRMARQKNQSFLIDVLRRLVDQKKDVKLLIIGNGYLENDIRQKAQRLGVEERVIIIEKSDAVFEYMSAMDYFLLPSLYEGLPVVAVEAQANGLFVIMSDRISSLAMITDRCMRLGISNCDSEKWAKSIADINDKRRRYYNEKVSAAGFGIEEVASEVALTYERINNEAH